MSKIDQVRLEFDGATKDELSLSGAAVVGDYLFLAPDERSSILRLHRRHRDLYDQPTKIDLRQVLPALPGAEDDELDLEGMDYARGYLWVLGSHSLVRGRVKNKTAPEKVPDVLGTVDDPASRQVLIRLALDATGDVPTPTAQATSGHESPHVSAFLGDGPEGLRAALAGDRHLEPLLDAPGKDNGLDFEGLAVIQDRVLLGLRGPVLRGWAIILEIHPEPSPGDSTRLQLAAFDRQEAVDRPYRKHFLDLGGLGIRDLNRRGPDLLILTGPTMVLDGPAQLVGLTGGAAIPLPTAIARDRFSMIDKRLSTDDGHPEALTVLDQDGEQLLICYDGPSGARLTKTGVLADRMDLDV